MLILDVPIRYPGRAVSAALAVLSSRCRNGCKDWLCRQHLKHVMGEYVERREENPESLSRGRTTSKGNKEVSVTEEKQQSEVSWKLRSVF